MLPFAQEYEDSGEFKFSKKLKDSLIMNGVLIGILCLGGVVIIIYRGIRHSGQPIRTDPDIDSAGVRTDLDAQGVLFEERPQEMGEQVPH